MKPSALLVAAAALSALAAGPRLTHAQQQQQQQQQPQPPAHETITWYAGDFPPHSIYTGADKGKGTHDLAIKDFMARLPQYNHREVDAVPLRMMQALASEPSSCTLQLLRTPEREKTIAYTSHPHTYFLPNAWVTLRKRLDDFKPYMNGKGEIRLDEALGSGKFKVAVSQGRTYGAAIDPVLQKHPDTKVMLSPSLANPLGMAMLKLLQQHEFDASFGYAVEMTYQVRDHHLDAADFVAIPIAGSKLMPVPVACSKTGQGRRILAELDKILAEPATQATFDSRYKSWLDPVVLPYYDELLKQARKGEK